MSGFITIERDMFEHPVFKPSEMTEREAFIWMIAKAAWKDTKHRVGRDLLPVPRGTFMVTLRELQAAFMWKSDTKVRNFLKTLENEKMIQRTTVGQRNAPKTHVSICNYDEYQSSGRTKNAPKTHQKRTKNAVKEQGNNKQEEDTYVSLSSDDDAPPPANDISKAVSRYNDAAEKAGWPKVQKLTPARSKRIKARLNDCGGAEGWEVALRKAFDSDFCRGNTSKPWAGFCFDWLTKSENFTKLMEGNYDNRSNNSPAPTKGPQNGADPALEQIARLAGLGQAQSNAGC